MSEIKFAGQVALVTGASRGIGAAIALELAHRGVIVIGTATSDDGAARIGAGLNAAPGAAGGCRGGNLAVNDVAAAEALIDDIGACSSTQSKFSCPENQNLFTRSEYNTLILSKCSQRQQGNKDYHNHFKHRRPLY